MSAIVPADATLLGSVSIGPGSVVHPTALLDARAGPIVLGHNCIVEERVAIVAGPAGISIGDANHFHAAARISAPSIGNCNVFLPRAVVSGPVANFCSVAPACVSHAPLPDRSVVYAHHSLRRDWSGLAVSQRLADHAKHLAYLRDLIPATHSLRLVT
ncbi:hypothetical protein MCUN1_002721 [Malassezia cuniculi]|uniref:Dynactin subunit 6 n=1 Tax=Malassezia cuniculi TaxID=948313 RepID=A0AAF0ERY3_9BASI|nr:hypothetical protein MCUN1_002721 [Malassezia cuniculi]